MDSDKHKLERLTDLLDYQFYRYPTQHCLSSIQEDQKVGYSTSQSLDIVNRLSMGLLSLGLNRGDRFGIYSANSCPEYTFFDLAALKIGLITIPIHDNYQESDLKYVLSETDLTCCFVSDQDLCNRLTATGFQGKIISRNQAQTIIYWKDLLRDYSEKEKLAFQEISESIFPEDLATIVYTSGSTGLPKGVMLSHQNIVSNIKSVLSFIPVGPGTKVASFLPLSHIFERMVVYSYLAVGADICFVEDKRELIRELKKIKPRYMTTVPRVLERAYKVIEDEISQRPLILRKILHWSIHTDREISNVSLFHPLNLIKRILANLLLYRHWRKSLGGKLKFMGVGAAALNPKLARLYSAAGIKIREGYGLTETSPVVSFNRYEPGGVHYGTVGIPVPGVKVRINKPDENGEGEIWIQGPNVMMGYYKNEELTNERMTEDRWFKTGDLGKFVYKRFLKITGRKKNIFKTSTGRYISPEKIEVQLAESPYISKALIFGANKPSVGALIIPDFGALQRWSNQNNVHWTAPQYMVLNPKVEYHYQSIVDQVNKQLKNIEKIRGFKLLHEDWANDEKALTATLKVKRHYVLQKHEKSIGQIYHKI